MSIVLKDAPKRFEGFCPIAPIPKGRPRTNYHTGRIYTPAATRKYETSVREWMKKAYGETLPMCGSVRAHYEFVLPKPANASKKILLSNKKPDVDNFVKAFQDALDFKPPSGGSYKGVLENDSRVSCLSAVKRYALDGEPLGTYFEFFSADSRVLITVPMPGNRIAAVLDKSIMRMSPKFLEENKVKYPEIEEALIMLPEDMLRDGKLMEILSSRMPNLEHVVII